MNQNEERQTQNGGGGYDASHPARHENRPLMTIANELVDRALEAESRAVNVDEAGYCEWRGRALRMAASLVFEVCGRPSPAAEALRGSHG